MSYAIYIRDLSFGYSNKEETLKGVDLSVENGDFLAIIGPNGGGKSTLLKIMLGLLEPKSGEIKLFGTSAKKSRHKVGFVPQDTEINVDFPVLVKDVVLMGYEGKRGFAVRYSKEELECARSALERVDMLEYKNRSIAELSGGQRQRVMIARALCTKGNLLLLDEPTANIDPNGQKEIYRLLKELQKQMSVVVVSHDISVILEYANKVAYLNRSLRVHDISDKKAVFHKHNSQAHFCEVELLEMLGSEKCSVCEEGGDG